jgi:phosphoribosylformylglycinamidine synthase
MAARVDGEVVKAPGELVLSTYVGCPDITARVTPVLCHEGGSLIYIPLNPAVQGKGSLGFFDAREFRLGGSAFAHVNGQVGNDCPDLEDSSLLRRAFETTQSLLLGAGQNGVRVSAGHDVSDGGLVTTIIEMCLAADRGARVDIPASAEVAR